MRRALAALALVAAADREEVSGYTLMVMLHCTIIKYGIVLRS